MKSGRTVAAALIPGDVAQPGYSVVAWVDEAENGLFDPGDQVVGEWRLDGKTLIGPDDTTPEWSLHAIPGSRRGVVFFPSGTAITHGNEIGVGFGSVSISDQRETGFGWSSRPAPGRCVHRCGTPNSACGPTSCGFGGIDATLPKAVVGGKRGFTLIELLVALAVFSIFMIGILNLLDSSTKVTELEKELADTQENVRFAAYHVMRMARMMGGAGIPFAGDTGGSDAWLAGRVASNQSGSFTTRFPLGAVEVLEGSDVLDGERVLRDRPVLHRRHRCSKPRSIRSSSTSPSTAA